ncbi:MAG: response regulator [Candidatus Omnitrophica bacterium]|nr:response regulator [Candidatus Omnitrophota bacterium]
MGKKILIIDDNERFLETTRDILKDYDYKVVTLCDPSQAEQYLKKERPDLLILDILMPGRSGFRIIEDFNEKNVYQDIPKLFLTVIDNSIDKMVADAYGVKAYIAKPFNPYELISKIRKCLGEDEEGDTL